MRSDAGNRVNWWRVATFLLLLHLLLGISGLYGVLAELTHFGKDRSLDHHCLPILYEAGSKIMTACQDGLVHTNSDIERIVSESLRESSLSITAYGLPGERIHLYCSDGTNQMLRESTLRELLDSGIDIRGPLGKYIYTVECKLGPEEMG